MIFKIFKQVCNIILVVSLILVFSCTKQLKKVDSSKSVSITNAWIRAAAAGMNTALFFDLKGSKYFGDTLKSVEADAAEIIQIHETVKDESGKMIMREIGATAVPRAKTIFFKPMGKHVMFIVLKNDLLADDSVKVKFNFAKSKPIIKSVIVKNFQKPGEK